jgi:hypothetical protein
MELLQAGSVAELTALIEAHGEDALFRGQTSHYGKLGEPSVVTSFDRHGCIPSRMLRWSRYAKNVLSVFVGEHAASREFDQALLQHYGWRSFYVDLSVSAGVGAWFASHRYSEQKMIEMSEDCEERPVWLGKRMARYDFEEGDGHLYVLDRDKAAKVGLIDLAALKIENRRPRTDAQQAWLLGPIRHAAVPVECFRAQITAGRAVLRDFAAECGLVETNDLFPPITEDPMLAALLSLPWREVVGSRGTGLPPTFVRALDLPEYQESYVKIAWPRTAFFRGATVAGTLDEIEGIPVAGIVEQVPEIVLFGSADRENPMRFPKIEELVRGNGAVAFEIDDIIQHANMGHMTSYQKGIGVVPYGDYLFELCELVLEHPGLDLTRAGFNKGWFYRQGEDGLWTRERHAEECDCGSAAVHDLHVSALHIAEAYLNEPEAFSKPECAINPCAGSDGPEAAAP